VPRLVIATQWKRLNLIVVLIKTADIFMGYRAWRIDPVRRELKPLAFHHSVSWQKMRKAVAHCEYWRRHPYEAAPARSCQCGLHGFKELSGVALMLRHYADARFPIVVGRIAFWGTIRDHTDGYRAQFAYPQALYYSSGLASCALVRAVGNEYACEAMPLSTARDSGEFYEKIA
jgi:hypothetical protein